MKNPPAGGLKGFVDSLQIISLMVFLVGAIVGATAGAQDLDTGVFRDLAATGRSRTALFLSRVGGAWVVVAALVAITLAVDFAGAFVLADGTPTPHVGDSPPRSRWCSPPACSARRWRSGSPRWSARAGR